MGLRCIPDHLVLMDTLKDSLRFPEFQILLSESVKSFLFVGTMTLHFAIGEITDTVFFILAS